MKTKLLLCALAFGLMSGTCSNDDAPATTPNECSCTLIHYERQQTGWSGSAPVYTYVEVAREPATNANCNTAVDDYTNNGSGEWYRVVCE